MRTWPTSSRALGHALTSLPKAAGSTVSTPGASAALTRVLAKALELISEMGDDYVATEHLLLALDLVDTSVRPLLAESRRRRRRTFARRSRPCVATAG